MNVERLPVALARRRFTATRFCICVFISIHAMREIYEGRRISPEAVSKPPAGSSAECRLCTSRLAMRMYGTRCPYQPFWYTSHCT